MSPISSRGNFRPPLLPVGLEGHIQLVEHHPPITRQRSARSRVDAVDTAVRALLQAVRGGRTGARRDDTGAQQQGGEAGRNRQGLGTKHADLRRRDSARHSAASQQCNRAGASGIGPAAYCARQGTCARTSRHIRQARQPAASSNYSPAAIGKVVRRAAARVARHERHASSIGETRKYADVLSANSRFVASGTRPRRETTRPPCETK